jgi:DNA-binding SARP family transcriptional activator
MYRWQLYLTGEVCAVSPRGCVAQSELHGHQGRTVLAALALAEGPLSASELADRLWDGHPPSSWETSLRVIIHRLRKALRPVAAEPDPLPHTNGSYGFASGNAWVDVRAAHALLHHAERDAGIGRSSAGPLAHAAACITRRPFLPGASGLWVEGQRRRLLELRGRALCRLAESWLEGGDAANAVLVGREAFDLDPISTRTTGTLVRALLGEGEAPRAIQTLNAHREAIRPLGVGLAPELVALRRRIERPKSPNVPTTSA